MILAHVTSTPFPMWDWVWIWSIVGAIDANLPLLFDRYEYYIPFKSVLTHCLSRAPLIQTTHRTTALFVYTTLLISLFTYGRFCTLVINDITEYMGIACFTVRKKDKEGNWKEVKRDSEAKKD